MKRDAVIISRTYFRWTMLLSISIPMKFLDLLRFIDTFNGMLISFMLSHFHDWYAEDHERDCELNHANTTWLPAQVCLRIASATSSFTYALFQCAG